MRRLWHQSLSGCLIGLALLTGEAARAASSLGAWRLTRQAQLELRTSPNVVLKAYYEAGSLGRGPRLWIDLPGAPSRSRSIDGSGPLRQVRIGKPDEQTTRLVLEFQPGIVLDPRRLRLVGTAPDRWRLDLLGLPSSGLIALGEGDVEAQSIAAEPTRPLFPTSARPLSADGLPVVPRGQFKVVIDPGHGGPDPGAIGIGGLRETDVVLDVALQVARLLQARGVEVLMTRTSEVDVDLPPRVALANSSAADATSVQSRDLAEALQRQMLAISGNSPDRGVRAARFFVIRRTTMPSTLVEMGFVTGQLDASRLRQPDFRRRMAVALSTGILDYLRRTP